jgi:hypothetical protein
MSGKRGAVGAILAAFVVAACSSVLGLDPPVLDDCLTGGCVDVTTPDVELPEVGVEVDSSSLEAQAEAEAEAQADAGVDSHGGGMCDASYDGNANQGIRCGGGCYPVVFCKPPEVCCQTTNQGTPTYACATSESACGGYTIKCVNENDCSGSDVCCHYTSHTVCASSCNSDSDTACVPGSHNDCPNGDNCDRPVTDDGVAAPYFTCGSD